MTISNPISDEDETHIRRLQVLHMTDMVNMFTDVRRGLEMMLAEDAADATFEWIERNLEYYLSGDWVHVSVTDKSDFHDGAYLREEERATDEIVSSIMKDLTRDQMQQLVDIERDDPEWIPKMMPSDYDILVEECRFELRQADRTRVRDQ